MYLAVMGGKSLRSEVVRSRGGGRIPPFGLIWTDFPPFCHFAILPFPHFSGVGCSVGMFPAVAQQMAAPLFKKKNNDSIFIKKGHADQLKWVSDAQSSKKSGKKNEDDKNKLYNAVVVSDVRPLVLSSFWDRKCSPNEFLILTPPLTPPYPGTTFWCGGVGWGVWGPNFFAYCGRCVWI